MQIRSKTYLHFISLWRSFRDAIPPHHGNVPCEVSPSLVFAAVVLALLVAILDVDAHRGELEWLGLLQGDYPIRAVFLSP